MKKMLAAGALAGALMAACAAQAQTPPEAGNPVRSFGAAGSSSVTSAPPGGQALRLYSVSISPGASAGYLMVFEADGVPASGAVAYPVLRYCAPVAGGATFGFSWGTTPDLFSKSVIVAFSSTGCTTFTPASAAWLGAQVQ